MKLEGYPTTDEEARKLIEEHLRKCREVEKQKAEEMYKVVKEIPPKYTL